MKLTVLNPFAGTCSTIQNVAVMPVVGSTIITGEGSFSVAEITIDYVNNEIVVYSDDFANITYHQSNHMFFAPLDEISEALNNNEGIKGYTPEQLKARVESNAELAYYVKNFDLKVH